MNENQLLEDLARLARQQEEASAARGQADVELLQPLDEQARARIADRVLGLMQEEAAAQEGGRTDAGAPAGAAPDIAPDMAKAAEPGAGKPMADVIPLRRRWFVVAAPALAAAAAILFLVLPRGGPAPGAASLPGFQMEVSGGRKAVRGGPEDSLLRVGPGDQVTLVLRPATAVEGRVSARVFVAGPDHGARPDGARSSRRLPDVAPEVSSDGAMRITGLGPALAALAPGRYRLVVAVARPEHLPDALPEAPAAPHAQLLEREVERVQP